MGLLKTFHDEDTSFGSAFIFSLIATIGTVAFAVGAAHLMGAAGVILVILLLPVVLGFAISAAFGAEIKRSFIIAVIFISVHLAVTFVMQAIRSS